MGIGNVNNSNCLPALASSTSRKQRTMMVACHWRRLQSICLVTALIITTVIGQTPLREDEFARLIQRRTEDSSETYQNDLSQYSLHFDRCQYVKMFDDELAEDEESDSPLAVKHFVVFRLCPSDSCGSCSKNFGRYVIEANNYLKYTVAEQEKAFEYMCENCQEQCNEENGGYCTGCGKICYKYDNLEANGLVDAAKYIECQKLDMNKADNGNEKNNGEDDAAQLYIGPRCSKDSSKILIGLFSDEDCLEPYNDADPETYLGAKLSYHLMSHTYHNDGSVCLSCEESDADANGGDQEDADGANEMCEEIYNLAAKCESKYGLNGGFIQTMKEEKQYENQVENEFMTCNFINSLLWNSYTEKGEIDVEDEQDVIIRDLTQLQKIALSLLGVSVVGLFASAYWTQKQIDNYYPKVDLACQSDTQIT